jgi:hypothetical protein
LESSGVLHQTVEVAGQLVTNRVVGVHGQREFALGSSHGTGIVKQVLTNRSAALELPLCRTLCQVAAVGGPCSHLKLPAEVVCQHSGKDEDLVAYHAPGGDNIEGGVLLGRAEQFFLGAATVVKQEDVRSCAGHVCGDGLVLEPVFDGREKVELQRTLHLFLAAFADDENTVLTVPFVRFPVAFKVRQVTVDTPPPSPGLNDRLALGKSFERQRARKFAVKPVEYMEDALVVERAVDVGFELDARKLFGCRYSVWAMKSTAPLESWTFPGRWCMP